MNAVTVPTTLPAEAPGLAERAGRVAQRCVYVVIESGEQFQGAAEELREVKSVEKRLEALRVSATGPINQALRTINDWFRKPMADLATAERNLKNGMAAWERKQRAKAEAEEAEARRRAQAEQEELQRRAARAAEQGKTEKAADLSARAAAVVPEAPATAPPKAKGMAFSPTWECRITNPALVPREYCKPDESMIRATVKATKGKVAIPGVEVWESTTVRAGT